MRLAVSIALVFGLFALLIAAAMSSDPTAWPLPVSWLIHQRIPVAILAILAAGVILGLASLWRAPRWFKFPVVALEMAAAALLTFYFVDGSFLPDHTLRVAVGEPFPAYELRDQDGKLRQYAAARPGDGGGREFAGKRALYLFYRGDW